MARGPAVDDFVSVEPLHINTHYPQGTEVLFNFEKNIKSHSQKSNNFRNISSMAQKEYETGFTFTTLLTIFGLMILPFIVWFGVMNKLDSKKKSELELTNDILSNYRTTNFEDIENGDKLNNDDDDYKKAG